jgi:hypothetical protein
MLRYGSAAGVDGAHPSARWLFAVRVESSATVVKRAADGGGRRPQNIGIAPDIKP